jgi:hypothetical protein
MTAAPQHPLFYSNPTPLDGQKHKDWAMRAGINLGFTAKAHAVPINAIEFAQACHHYPVVFSPDEGAVPVAILGLTEGENLFVNTNGDWHEAGSYIPSYIRRYPFILAEVKDTDQLTLCIDDTLAVIDRSSAMKLFDGSGKPTAMTSNALEFCKSFHAATLQTREFCVALNASGLLVAREAEIPLPNGQKLRFGGFRVIDEQKWTTLDDQTFLEWRRRGWAAAVYAAIFSNSQWNTLARLHVARHGAKAA